MNTEASPLEILQHEPMSARQWYVVAICIGILALDGPLPYLSRRGVALENIALMMAGGSFLAGVAVFFLRTQTQAEPA